MTTLNGKRIQNILLKRQRKDFTFCMFLKVITLHAQDDLKSFYTAVIRSTLEYGAQVWNGGLTKKQKPGYRKDTKTSSTKHLPRI